MYAGSTSRDGRRGASAHSQTRSAEDGRISEEDDSARGTDDDLSDEDLHDDEETGLTGRDRRRKQKKRRHNTALDNRVAGEAITAEEKKEADQNVIKKSLINILLILLWYLFSLSISLVRRQEPLSFSRVGN
jgi:solute carrier family 35, member C2